MTTSPKEPPPIWLRRTIFIGLPVGAAVVARVVAGGVLVPILAFVVGFVVAFQILGRLVPDRGRFVGTRAWEAQHNLKLINDLVAGRLAEMPGANETRRGRLVREIEFLEAQIPEERAILLANDGTPARGYVGVNQLPPD